MKSSVKINRTITHSEHVIMQAHQDGEEFKLSLSCKKTDDYVRLLLSRAEAEHLVQQMSKMLTAILLLLALTTTKACAQVLISDANTGAPTLYELSHLSPTEPTTPKTLLIFNSPREAKTWTTIIGYTGIAAGAYLGGKAEMKSRYHGTTRNWDSYHITRDAGLVVTSFGSASLGASITIGEKVKPLEILWKAASGAVLYRIVAQATYNATKPR